jgi:hypothetical protein
MIINCDTLEPGWKTHNANDGSNEGIARQPPLHTAQFR